jgi:chitodextrinase
MPFTNSNFGLWNDDQLTSPFSGTLSAVNYTDFSDNPQDFVLYLGSPSEETKLQALSNPGIDNLVLTPTDILQEWEADTVYTEGTIVQPVGGNGLIYKCTTAGTSDSSEPSWPTSGIGSTVVDNTAIWTLYAAHHPSTEIKLALTSGELGSATGGASLAVGPTVLGGVDNLVEINIRLTNTVATVSNNAGNEEIGIYMNAAIELGV